MDVAKLRRAFEQLLEDADESGDEPAFGWEYHRQLALERFARDGVAALAATEPDAERVGPEVSLSEDAVARIARTLFTCGEEVAERLMLVHDPGPGEYAKLATGKNLGGLGETAVVSRLHYAINVELRRAAGEG